MKPRTTTPQVEVLWNWNKLEWCVFWTLGWRHRRTVETLCRSSVVFLCVTPVGVHWVEFFLSPEPESTKWCVLNGENIISGELSLQHPCLYNMVPVVHFVNCAYLLKYCASLNQTTVLLQLHLHLQRAALIHQMKAWVSLQKCSSAGLRVGDLVHHH